MNVRTEWPGRPTRAAYLRPRGIRERLAALVGPSLVERYDFELGAETTRANDGWSQYVEAQRELSAHGIRWWPGKAPSAPGTEGDA